MTVDREMLDGSRSIELDPDLLSTPFGVQTNWHVITGAAGSGKTTLIDLLADKARSGATRGGGKWLNC